MTTKMTVGAYAAAGAMILSQLSAVPAYACEQVWCGFGGEGDNNSVSITVNNSGSISNTTEAKADTGDNYAGGSYGGDGNDGGNGGDGGEAEVEGGLDWCGECSDDNGSEANGGDGGNGGNSNGGDAGAGGLVVTGDATAEAGTENVLNTTEVEVEGCGCEDDNDDCGCLPPWFEKGDNNRIKVRINNTGAISNTTEAKADTGDNKAKGSYGGDGNDGGNGGDGGEAEVGDDNKHHGDEGCGCELELPSGDGTANGGDGGEGGDSNGGDGDVGGTVQTGNARSEAGTINVMNTVLVRVTR